MIYADRYWELSLETSLDRKESDIFTVSHMAKLPGIRTGGVSKASSRHTSQSIEPALNILIPSCSSCGSLIAAPQVKVHDQDQSNTKYRYSNRGENTGLFPIRLKPTMSQTENGLLLTVYLGLSSALKATPAMTPPTPPPRIQTALATALLECWVMLLAWKVRTPGMQN